MLCADVVHDIVRGEKNSRFRGLSQLDIRIQQFCDRVGKGKASFEYVVTTVVYGWLAPIWNIHAFTIARIHDSGHRKIIIKWIADLFPWCPLATAARHPGRALPFRRRSPSGTIQPAPGHSAQRREDAPAVYTGAMAIETPLATSMFVRLRSCTQLADYELRSAMSSAMDMRGPAIEMRCFYGRARGALWVVHAQLKPMLAAAKLNN